MDRALARAPRWRAWWACAAALMQAACNGGGESVPTRLHATADSAGADFDAHALLDYAERVYPQFFPGPAIDQVSAPYIYRHYPATGNYVGVAGETVSVLGPLSGGNVHEVGRLGDFRCLAWPERCSRPQGPWVVAGPSSFALLGAGGEIRAWTRFDANDRLGLTTLPRSADGLTRTLGRAGSAVQLTASFGILLGDDRKGYIWGTGATTYAAEYSLAVSLPAAAPAPMNWPGPLQQLELDAGVRLGSVSGGVQTSGLPTALLADGTV